MKARDIMSTPVVTIGGEATLEEAARQMLDRRIGGLAVVDPAGRAIGFLTESDFGAKERGVPFSLFRAPQILGQWLSDEAIERVYAGARHLRVRDAMSHDVISAREDDPVEHVARLMVDRDVNRIVILRDAIPVGIVARHDLLRLLVDPRRQGR